LNSLSREGRSFDNQRREDPDKRKDHVGKELLEGVGRAIDSSGHREREGPGECGLTSEGRLASEWYQSLDSLLSEAGRSGRI